MKKRTLLSLLLTLAMALSLCSGALAADDSGTKTLTRGKFVTELFEICGSDDTAAQQEFFSDVPAEGDLAQAVNWAVAAGVVNGYADGTFRPEKAVTREQMAAMFYRYAQKIGKGFTGTWMFPLNFPDADKITPYADEAMHWVVMNGIIIGTGKGLEPQALSTENQLSIVLDRWQKSLSDSEDAVEIDYGSSALYETAELDTAISLIRATFDTWEGCELHSLRYAGDEANTEENVKWLSEIGDGAKFTHAMKFVSNFHSPVEAYGAWEADHEYENYEWWLGKTESGEWQLVSWGY